MINRLEIKQLISKLNKWLKNQFQFVKKINKLITPGKQAWNGAAAGICLLGFFFLIVLAASFALPAGWVYFFAIIIIFPIAFYLGVSLILLIFQKILKLPEPFLLISSVGFLLTMVSFGFINLPGAIVGALVFVFGGFFGAGVWTVIRGAWGRLHKTQRVVTLIGIVIGIVGISISAFWLLRLGQPFQAIDPVISSPNLPSIAPNMEDPSLQGDYPVSFLTYGRGTDKRRPEFADQVAIITDVVDGSDFINKWSRLRTMIWGMDATELPLNGRVWYPQGEGKFPLVLIVHGNHLAEDYSDPGYEYLCDLLASRGTICVSIDQNFINSSFVSNFLGFQRLENENDLRGWLLLEHLSAWHDFAVNPATPFNGIVDLENIGLIGHSRGGEAVAIASAFNNLPYYPENALKKFDFNFDIKSVVAIAPIDRQYQPSSQRIPIKNVNYLVLQGSHDMDVVSFDGYNVFTRASFDDGAFYFKSALHIGGANHGQFNSVWGNDDRGKPIIWLYNRNGLIDKQDQMKIAQVFISAFFEATLHGQWDYLPLFENYQFGLDWLPDTVYHNAYGDSNTVYLATFDEDIDLSTGTMTEVQLRGENLSTWNEDRVATKWGRMHSTSAVYLGWAEGDLTGTYTITYPADQIKLNSADQLKITVAQVGQNLNADGTPTPIDFSIKLADINQQQAVLTLSKITKLQPEMDIQIYKLGFLPNQPTSEIVFQTYLFNLADFLDLNMALDILQMNSISLEFDKTSSGTIALDNIGFRIHSESISE